MKQLLHPLLYCWLFCWTAFGMKTMAQDLKPEKTNRILFLLDVSASMDNQWHSGGGSKMDAARQVLDEQIDKLKLKPNMEIALRVFGSLSPYTANDCSDTKLLVPFGKANIPYIKEAINTVRPNGVTPIAMSLQKAADDFPADENARNIIIMITDGEESCGGDPCAISLALQKKQIFLRPFVIALDNEDAMAQKFECMGNYYRASSPETLRNSLAAIVDLALNPTYVQVDLLDLNGRPSETDVDLSFSDTYTHLDKYQYYQTITYTGVPDTLNLDPVTRYDLTVHTIPEIVKTGISLKPNQVNFVNVPAPQGFLLVKMQTPSIDNYINNKIKCIIRQQGQQGTTNVQKMNTSEKYLCGHYDLEFLTLPRTRIPDIDIAESQTTTIQIPAPGQLSINKSYPVFGGIFYYHNNRWELLYELNQNLGNESVALQPGTYRLVYRSKNARKTTDSKIQTITITGGSNASVTL